MAIVARSRDPILPVASETSISPRLALAILGHIMAHGLAGPGLNAGGATHRAASLLQGPKNASAYPQSQSLSIANLGGRGTWAQLKDQRFSAQAPGLVRPALAPTPPRAAETVRYATEPAVHPAQQQLLVLTREQPGLNIHEMAARLNLSRSATRYHLRGLIRSARVVTHRQGHHLLHFSAKMTNSERAAVALLRINSVRMVVEAVFQNPLVHPARLAAKLGFSARSVRRSVRMLVRAGLARPDRDPALLGGYRLNLHPDIRLAWVLWCKGAAPEAVDQAPPQAASAWIVPVEIVLGLLASL